MYSWYVIFFFKFKFAKRTSYENIESVILTDVCLVVINEILFPKELVKKNIILFR